MIIASSWGLNVLTTNNNTPTGYGGWDSGREIKSSRNDFFFHFTETSHKLNTHDDVAENSFFESKLLAS